MFYHFFYKRKSFTPRVHNKIAFKNIIFIFTICFLPNLFAQKSTYEFIETSKKEFGSGNYQEALGISLKALAQAEQTQIPVELALANLQVGTSYYYNGDKKEEVLLYFYNARNYIYRYNLDSLKAKINHNIGSIYVENGNRDSADYYLTQAVNNFILHKKYADLSRTYCVLAELHFQNKKELDKALEYIDKAEVAAKLSNEYSNFAFAKIKRGNYYFCIKDYKEALVYYFQAKQIYEENNDKDGRLYIYKLIANAKACSYNPEIKDAYYEYLNLKDTLFKAESAKKIAEYKTLFETEKKEQENKLLVQENNLKQVELDNRNITILILGILILLIVIIVLWRVNVINLRKKEQELVATKKIQKEKERLSRDLHDNIGSLVSFISTKVDWITKNRKIDNDLQEDLNLVKTNSKNLISGLRETLWTLNANQITNFELVDKLKPYIKSNLLVTFYINDDLEKESVLNSELVLNVYRCCQEIVNNINKHSQAKQVNIVFSNQNNSKLTIIISDDGIGISEEDERKENHYGLKNIKSRLKEVGALFNIMSEPNKGTNITIIIN